MAVNSASDRSNQDDAVRRTRETYQKREAENAKKNSKQVKSITESAQAELENVKAEHATQMEELKAKTRDSITRRDMQYQKEISELRDMHQKQLQRVASDSEMKLSETERALKNEIDRTEKTTAQQREVLKSNYEDQLKSKDQAFQDFTSESLSKQEQARSGITDRLNKAHEKEMKEVIKDRDEGRLASEREMRTYRHNKDQQAKTAERNHKAEVARLTENDETTMKNMAADNQLARDLARADVDAGLKRTRERFEKATEQLSENAEKAREGLEGTVNGRLGDRVKSLEAENRKLKGDIPRLEMKLGRQKSLEMQNLRDEMGRNMDNLEKARQQTVEASNRKTGDEMNKKNQDNDATLTRTHKFYQDKMSMEDLRSEERLSNTETSYQKQLASEKTTNEGRFTKLKNFNELEQGRLKSYFDRSTTAMKDNFETTLRDMRVSLISDVEDKKVMFHETVCVLDRRWLRSHGTSTPELKRLEGT